MTRDGGRTGEGDEANADDPTETDDLAARLDELETGLRTLRQHTEPPRGPLGLPRPPTPREFAAFADTHAIPATIAFLQAHIRALQALQAALRLARGTERTQRDVDRARDRARDLGTRTMESLDQALDDLQTAYREGTLPNDADARAVLADARRLTAEIRDELEQVDAPSAQDTSGDDGEPAARDGSARDPRIDPEEVETELDVLRDEFGDHDDDVAANEGGAAASDDDGDAASDDDGDAASDDDGGADGHDTDTPEDGNRSRAGDSDDER